MTRIYLIDDSFNRHLQLSQLVDSLKKEGFHGDQCSDENDAKTKAAQSRNIDQLWDLISTADADSIFLVDFDLRLDSHQVIQATTTLRGKLNDNSMPWIGAAKTILEQYYPRDDNGSVDRKYYPAIFALAVLKARGIPSILVSTAAYQVAESVGVNLGFPMSATDQPNAHEGWRAEILKLVRHSDPHLRKILCAYQHPISGAADAWDHDWCGNNSDRGLEVLSIGSFNSGGSECKALYERKKGAWEFEKADCLLSKATLEFALSAFGIAATVTSGYFRFPAHPGLAFLISLKEMLVASKDKGPPNSIEFFSHSNASGIPEVCGLKITLNGSADGHFGLAPMARLMEKLQQAGADSVGPSGGLSEGIWNLGHCKSKGIRTAGEPWAEMFHKGSPYWVAWPSFAENSITFHWT